MKKPTVKELQAELRSLKNEMRDYINKVQYPATVTMWTWPKAKLQDGWRLDGIVQRVEAADQLGYDVCLVSTEVGLKVIYKKKSPYPPSL